MANGRNKDQSCLGGTPIAWTSGGSLRAATCNILLRRGNTRFVAWIRRFSFRKEYVTRVTYWIGNVAVESGIRNDNSRVLEHVHSIKLVTKERRSIGFLGSNRVDPGKNPWLALSHIAGPVNISDEMAQSTAHKHLITLLGRNISQSVGEMAKDEIRET